MDGDNEDWDMMHVIYINIANLYDSQASLTRMYSASYSTSNWQRY